MIMRMKKERKRADDCKCGRPLSRIEKISQKTMDYFVILCENRNKCGVIT